MSLNNLNNICLKKHFFQVIQVLKVQDVLVYVKTKILIQENVVMALYGRKAQELYQEQYENAKKLINHVIYIIMKSTEMLNQIKTLLNIEVKLEEQKLENGTRVEAESFEKGKEIFILTDDEKVAMPVGEYLLEDGRLVVVAEEGIIDDVREVSDEVPQKEEESKDETEDLEEEEEEMEEEADVQDWAGMEKRIKNLEDAIADLKSKL